MHLRALPRSIGSRVVLIVVAVSGMMALATAGLAAWNAAHQRDLAREEMGRAVRALAVALDQEILKTAAALESLGASLAEDGGPERLHRVAKAVVAKRPYWSHATLRDAEGAPVFTTAMPFGAPVPNAAAAQPLVAETLASGRTQVSDLFDGPIAGAPVTSVFVPVETREGRHHVLSATISASGWARLLHEQQVPAGWVAGIVDRGGTVVARTNHAERSVGRQAPGWVLAAIRSAPAGLAEGPALDGTPASLAFARSDVSGWTVGLAARNSVLDAPQRRALQLSAAAAAAGLALAFALALALARRLSSSLAGLARVVEALRDPGASIPAPPRSGVAELEALYRSVREAGAHLRRAEEHRETLMRELQHRAKNDLQAITGLIALAGGSAESAETGGVLADLQGRVEALRLAHSRLYEAGEVGTIELGGYLRELCANAIALHGGGRGKAIAFRASVETVHVGHDTAVSLGLIANEFVTNSAKHAFAQGGTIALELAAEGDPAGAGSRRGLIRLRLRDDGVGIPRERGRSSGTALIETLAGQIGAEVEWSTAGGTSLGLTFRAGDAA